MLFRSTTCGATISNASITGVFSHLMQYHIGDLYCAFSSVKDVPVRCAWDGCGQSRESAQSLCEHIVAQHINVWEPEGYMNSELMYGPYWPSTMEEPTCTMPSGSPSLQKPLGQSWGSLVIGHPVAEFGGSQTYRYTSPYIRADRSLATAF